MKSSIYKFLATIGTICFCGLMVALLAVGRAVGKAAVALVPEFLCYILTGLAAIVLITSIPSATRRRLSTSVSDTLMRCLSNNVSDTSKRIQIWKAPAWKIGLGLALMMLIVGICWH